MARKIKVLHLGSPSGLYGAERWILSLIKYLDVDHVESVIGSINDDNSNEIPLCVEGEKLGFKSIVIESHGKFNYSAVKQLKDTIVRNKIDIIHAHGYKTDLIGFFASLGTQCKIVTTPHGWTNNPEFKLRVYEIFDRLIFPFLDAVVPLSEGIYKPLSYFPGLKNKLSLINNGVDIDEIDNIVTPSDEIASLRSSGKFVIGYIGRLVPGKGLDTLLKAIAEYKRPNWHVVLIGEGEQSADLAELAASLGISDKIEFMGFRDDRLSMLKGFDIFVLPSRSEGIPRCIMEAMAANIPVIASDITGCRYLIDGSTTGLLHEVDNPIDLASKIEKIESDFSLRDRLMRNGRMYIDSNYSAARMAKEYEELYASLL